MNVACAILAGGRSQRFGSDKAQALVAGVTMLEHQIARLPPTLPLLAVVADRADRFAGIGLPLPVITDDASHRGPLLGVVAALEQAARLDVAAVLILPVDWLGWQPQWLLDLAAASSARPACFAGERGAEPLPCCWPTALLSGLRERLDQDRGSLRAALLAAEATILPQPAGWADCVQANTPEALAAWAAGRAVG